MRAEIKNKHLNRLRIPALLSFCLFFLTTAGYGQELLYDSVAANVLSASHLQIKGAVDCDNAITTAAMQRCANLAFQESHRALEKEVEAVIRYFVKEGQAEQRWLFITAQNHWMQYRNHYCSIYWRQYQGGSLQSFVFTDCLTRQTNKRLTEVQELEEFVSIK